MSDEFHLPGRDTAWEIPLRVFEKVAYFFVTKRGRAFHLSDCSSIRNTLHWNVHFGGCKKAGLRACRICLSEAWEEFDASLPKNVLDIPPVEDPQVSTMLGLIADGDII